MDKQVTQAQMSAILSKSSEIKCTCGNNTFVEVLFLRKVSRLLTGQPKDALMPIPVFACNKCQKVVEELIPKEIIEANSAPAAPEPPAPSLIVPA